MQNKIDTDQIVKEGRLHQGQAHLSYVQVGQGHDVWLLFHGFGQRKEFLLQWAAALAGRGGRVFVFDLFFHGESRWVAGRQLLTNQRWRDWLIAFLEQERIGHFSVGGYSMGGKFAIASASGLPERVNRCWLVAADGVERNFWYGVATRHTSLRRLFKYFVVRPRGMYRLFRLVRRLGLVDQRVVDFSHRQVATRKRRVRLYYAWVVFRELFSSMQHFAHVAQKHDIALQIILGKDDKLITPKSMQPLRRASPEIPYTVIEADHENLLDRLAAQITKGDWDAAL